MKIIKKLNDRIKKLILFNIYGFFILSPLIFIFTNNWITSLISTFTTQALITIYIIGARQLKESAKLKKMENALPDFLQLMSSNLRAGMTIDQALLLSSRKEFAPLDKEILKLGKDIVTGKKIEIALQDMADRINSVKIKKTVTLIISGIKSGGNLAILLEETSRNIKEKEFVEKRAASNTLMYVIFIFFATAAGAPFLFALSSVLVEVMTNLFSTLPEVETTSQTPFAITEVSISITFIKYFSVIFIIVIDILGSLIIGLVSKGEEKEGLKYVAPLVITGITIFFVVRGVILSYFSDLI